MAKRSTTPQLVTKESLRTMIEQADERRRAVIVGRALVVLFNRQTADEKQSNSTDNSNSVGFSGSDARIGSLGAKYFLKNKTLQQWQVNQWTRLQHGYPKICKYARQLNEAAVAKQEQ